MGGFTYSGRGTKTKLLGDLRAATLDPGVRRVAGELVDQYAGETEARLLITGYVDPGKGTSFSGTIRRVSDVELAAEGQARTAQAQAPAPVERKPERRRSRPEPVIEPAAEPATEPAGLTP